MCSTMVLAVGVAHVDAEGEMRVRYGDLARFQIRFVLDRGCLAGLQVLHRDGRIFALEMFGGLNGHRLVVPNTCAAYRQTATFYVR
jgi:hypothetical protein